MTGAAPRGMEPPARAGGRREPLVPSQVLAVLLSIFAELMLFTGLLSAHAITKSSALGGAWPPPNQPRLPVEVTGFNTALLLASGVLLFLGGRAFMSAAPRGRGLLVAALALGSAFVGLQGVEWVRLVHEGLTVASGPHGGFFYLIVGLHALHALGAIAGLGWVIRRAFAGTLLPAQLHAAQAFWYFVVALWPIIYWRVYF